MRIVLSLSLKPGVVLPFQYQDALLSTLHRWLGRDNELHDAPRSLYSFGPLEGLRPAHGGLVASTEFVRWQLSLHEEAAINLMNGIAGQVLPGLAVHIVSLQSDSMTLPWQQPPHRGPLRVLSPVLVQAQDRRLLDNARNERGTRDHLLPDHPRHAEHLTVALRRKLADAGLPDSGCDVRMLPHCYKTKLIRLKGLDFRCAVAPVLITGTDEQRRFARTVGVGHSTGCGFGFLG